MPLDSTRQDFDIRPFLNQPLGAEVLGLDLARPLSIDDFDRLHRAHLELLSRSQGSAQS
jgi:taurine dioxygenase